jgi:hypothetical protein
MLRFGIRSTLRQFGIYPDLPSQGGLIPQLSELVWRIWSRDCDRGPISRTGVSTELLTLAWAARFQAEIDAAPSTTITAEDTKPLYFTEPRPAELAYLNRVNEYRAVTPSLLQALREFLAENRQTIDERLGHPWRVASVRQFYLRPGEGPEGHPGNKHLDGWPPAIRKLFILPAGATPRTGTTWFRMRDGRETLLDEARPLWSMFENSRVLHALTPGKVPRPTIELNLVPARKTSTDPAYVGINAWYPRFPWN